MRTLLFTTALFLGLLTTNAQNKTTEVVVKMENVKQQKGAWMIAVFSKNDNFLGQKPSFAKRQDLKEGNQVVFNLPKGEYAIAMFQDLNGNMDLDRDSKGIPTEPYSFSGNVLPLRGMPTFEATKFKVKRKPMTVVLPVQN
jgi:uncharacterized protein (DUF2141 family)